MHFGLGASKKTDGMFRAVRDRRLLRRCLAYATGVVVLAYAANAWFNHTALGLAFKSQHGAYFLGFYLLFGIAVPALFLAWVIAVGLAPARWLGARIGWRDVGATLAAGAAGGLLAAVLLAPLLHGAGSVELVCHYFARLLVASTAEVLIFLGVFGTAVQLAGQGAVPWRVNLGALVASSLVFGFFHLTYPEPWNTLGTCLGLSVVWAGVSLVFLSSRSLLAAIAINNILAVIGFIKNGIELPGEAVPSWHQAIIALIVFVLILRGGMPCVEQFSQVS